MIIAGGLGVTGNVNIAGTSTFTGTVTVPTPINPSDACTKAYCDAAIQGLSIKNSVLVATTANGTFASSFVNGSVIDGITLATGNRILLKNQTTATQNGIYTVNATGAPTLASDFSVGTHVAGIFVFIETGTINGSTGWVITNTAGSDLVGTNAIIFTQFSTAGSLTAGGWRILVIGTLTLNGTISNNGASAVGNVAGAAVTVQTTYLGCGTSGGAGVTNTGTGVAGITATQTTYGGRGGASGAILGGALLLANEYDGGQNIFNTMPNAWLARLPVAKTANSPYIMGGTGGGGASGNRGTATTIISGGGGAGAGLVVVAAKIVTGTGTISANGGNGGNASYTGAGTPGATSGGGGGGGGVVVLICQIPISTITLTANGGSGGTPVGTGVSGTAGSAGSVYRFQI
ncbi:hypothetical protein HDU81_007948 [Chytriomyces hyalinus]|nr:hypothetical protein HDU81_007948 [Chytriomyces hyalinus]